ncbi:transposase family protein [Kitasatospora griseola]|uniref:transposase family protein n=1 Tax=Kitasatospora griseola TaxID=2064 RepID=UPI003820BC1D
MDLGDQARPFQRDHRHPLTAAQKEANRLVSRERAANEHGFADLKNWRILTKVRMNARHATTLLRAPLVLTNAQVSALTDDRPPAITPPTGTSTPAPTRTSPTTCKFKLEHAH